MLRAEHLVKTFTKNEKKQKKIQFNAVDDISIDIKEGEIVGILGPNGAGKTTLLRMLGSLMKPTSGKVIMEDEGVLVDDERIIKQTIGYLSGNTKLYGRLSTRELLNIMGNIYGMTKEEISERIDEICKILNMEEFIDNRIEKLSTGQTQRASISRCLMHKPKLYIFDEPTLGLDILSSSAIVEFIKNERENGKSVIYSTHYMEEAEYLCDRIIIINAGKIIYEGTVDNLKQEVGQENLRDAFRILINKEGVDYEF
ncbi:MAG: ATP-binding cassette domain-containing protein [Lachnospiraceae bacterium]|nr:ATP-binding cassette domain-containing protein [Lachnospiraceae bacterium]